MSKAEKDAEKIEQAKEFFYETALEACQTHYERLIDVRKVLESKAQTTITVSGIFIAGVFAFIRDIKALHLPQPDKDLLVVTVVLLILSIFCSVLVLLLRAISLPMTGKDVSKIIQDLKNLIPQENQSGQEEVFASRKIDFIEEQITIFEKSVLSIEKSNKSKVYFLWSAHVSCYWQFFWWEG